MSDSPERLIQLEFRCRSCGLAGLTPEVTQQEALHLAGGELEIRCPKCRAILIIQTSGLDLLAKLDVLAKRPAARLRELVQQALARELERRRDDG